MIASATETIKLIRNTNRTDRQILNEIVDEIPQIANEIDRLD